VEAATPFIAAAERERIRRAVNSDGFQATIRSYCIDGYGADDVSDAVLDLLDGSASDTEVIRLMALATEAEPRGDLDQDAP
jgi:hypothetical protein